jgi:hypothetical protein
MLQLPFHLRYTLNRWQRLIPHLRVWDVGGILAVVGLAGASTALAWSWWPLLFLAVWVWFFGNFFRGLLDVLLRGRVEMDLEIQEIGLGFLDGGQRWWLFLDGFLRIEQLTPGVWTLQHFNGHVVHIPADAITAEQLAHIRTAAARGQTPEGIRAVIERGRRLAQLEAEERRRGKG